MFFDNLEEIIGFAQLNNFSIFATPVEDSLLLLEKKFKPNVFTLSPDEKTNKISVDMIRNFISLTETKDKIDRFFVVKNAETMNETAENAFLKNLEEPKYFHHFIFLTKFPSALLPTVLSRAKIYYLKEKDVLSAPISTPDKIKDYAKKLIVADTKGLIALANELSKKKDNPRDFSLKVVATSIEMLYKTYFKTGDKKFLKRLPNLLKLYDALAHNGHIKLHFVADML